MESASEILTSTPPGPVQVDSPRLIKQNPWGATSSPWGTTPTPVLPCSLSSVMDEEYAKVLQKEEQIAALDEGLGAPYNLPGTVELSSSGETDSDMLLAQMLQLQFDREHDDLLRKEEQKFNGDSKVSVSWANYQTGSSAIYDQDDSDEEDWEVEEEIKGKKQVSSRKSTATVKTKNGYITKHDANICGRKNASMIVDQFPPAFSSGNASGMDIKLSNAVYNSLKMHSVEEERKSHRVHEKKEHSTVEMAVDPNTRILLFKLLNGGILESINGTISTGKEAVIIHATGGQSEETLVPNEVALKVYKTTLNEFKTRGKYIKDDFHFKDRFSKQNPRKIIKMWAEKEMLNLNRMRKYGIRCPEVILLRKHILVMSFIGEDHKAAPKLKNVRLSSADKEIAYDQCVDMMVRLYKDCNLVHADLSEYNMLWHKGEVWFIDVSQSVEPIHPRGLEFLLRDCGNVSSFFTRIGVHKVLKQHELFNKITGLELKDGNKMEFLSQIECLQKSAEFDLVQQPSYNHFTFDHFFEKTMEEEKIQDAEEDHLEGD